MSIKVITLFTIENWTKECFILLYKKNEHILNINT